MSYTVYLVAGVLGLVILIWIMTRRRVVSTDVVHIVQRRKATVSYGVGCDKNVYYEWPASFPVIGVTVRELPITNFDLTINEFPAYDKDRIPFFVDVKAFFRVTDTNVAASRVESFKELRDHLLGIVQGTVRSILAKSKLEEIMEERSIYGNQFTENVKDNLKEWGIQVVKNIELMDVRDAVGSLVIENIMAKQKSAIEKESRIVVADNMKKAQEAEIIATQQVEMQKADSAKLVGEAQAKSQRDIGIAQANANKEKGIADEKANQSIQEEAKITAERNMDVERVSQVRTVEIAKESAIVTAEQQREQMRIDAEAKQKQMQINADAEKYKIEVAAAAEKSQVAIAADAERYKIENIAQANLASEKNKAEGIKAVGESEAEIIKAKGLAEATAEKEKQLASVIAQVTLAKDIGENEGYQNYLVRIKEVEANMEIGIKQAEYFGTALQKADLKVLANTGDVQSGINKLTDLFTSKGGAAFNGLTEALKHTEDGADLVKGVLGKLTKPAEPKA